MRKICVVTGSRAEYGLLRWIMRSILDSSEFELRVMVTGMHLSPEFGLTVGEIEADGFEIDRKVETLLSSDTAVGVTKAMGLGLIGFADVLAEQRPDLLLVVGDRYEIFVAVTAAMIARIPVAHVHGGETTAGAIDEAIRHSITKMSQIHFVAAEEYRDRVIQLGEHPDRVFNVGGLGIDNILRMKLLTLEELEEVLCFKLFARNLLVTFHPVTLERDYGSEQLEELLLALADLEDTGLIFTMPNADGEGRLFFDRIQLFCSSHPNAKVYKSLGQLTYLSCIKHVDGVVGNSSSGLLEVPSFKKGTVNIGSRQFGRIRARSVIDCEPDKGCISKALTRLYSPEFQASLARVKNPYGDGGASRRIIDLLKCMNELPLKKVFFDL